jgi:hypothetical protein
MYTLFLLVADKASRNQLDLAFNSNHHIPLLNHPIHSMLQLCKQRIIAYPQLSPSLNQPAQLSSFNPRRIPGQSQSTTRKQ